MLIRAIYITVKKQTNKKKNMEVDLAQHRSPQLQDLGQCHSHIFHSRDYSLCVLKVPNGNAIRTGVRGVDDSPA